jgi:DNA-binding response OmpR family regulator
MPDRQPLVLVVEDEEGIRDALDKFLRLNGFDVVSATTANEALAHLSTRPPDAAIVDLRLPQGSGRDIVASIPVPTPVVIFSGAPGEAEGLDGVRPNTRLILKPFSLTMLIETLKKMLGAAAPPPRQA